MRELRTRISEVESIWNLGLAEYLSSDECCRQTSSPPMDTELARALPAAIHVGNIAAIADRVRDTLAVRGYWLPERR